MEIEGIFFIWRLFMVCFHFFQVYTELEAIGAEKAEAKARRILSVRPLQNFVMFLKWLQCINVRGYLLP